MLKLAFCVLLLLVCGCVTAPEYDPMRVVQEQVFVLNEPALKGLKLGMSRDEVRRRMGQAIIIGYNYENGSSKAAAKPITIANPYKSENIKTAQGTCAAEYYVTALRHPDGVITDDELMPLVFCNGVLAEKGRKGSQD